MSFVASAVSWCATDHCITCADEGVAMAVVRVNDSAGLALCSNGEGVRTTVETALLEPLFPGDRVLVHAGVAIATLLADESLTRAEQRLPQPAQTGPQPTRRVAR